MHSDYYNMIFGEKLANILYEGRGKRIKSANGNF